MQAITAAAEAPMQLNQRQAVELPMIRATNFVEALLLTAL